MKELLKKKSVKVALLFIVAAVIAVIVGMNVQSAQKEKEYNAHIEAAEKYLTELDYEQAIAEYTLALEIEPNAEEVLNGLEKTYLAYADALADAGEYEKAIEILNEGYAQTGRESLQEKLVQIQEMQAQSEEEERIKAEEEKKKAQAIELPFDNITICGYGLDEAYSEQILSMYPTDETGHGTDASKGYYWITQTEEIGLHVFPTNTSDWDCYWNDYSISVMLKNDGQPLDISEFNMPIGLGDTYDDWCRVMPIDRIKEIGQKSVRDEGEVWSFVTNECECEYIENHTGGLAVDFTCKIRSNWSNLSDYGKGKPVEIEVCIDYDGRINRIDFFYIF